MAGEELRVNGKTPRYGRRREKAIHTNTGGSPGFQSQSQKPGNVPSEEVR